jgi:hypothetical protein
MKKINWLYVGIGAVVLYFIYQKMNEDKARIASAPINPQAKPNFSTKSSELETKCDYTQGELFNMRYSASGTPNKRGCYCEDGTYLGIMRPYMCNYRCRRSKKKEWI